MTLTQGIFNQIGQSNETLSMPELLFRERKAGRIGEQEYQVGTAVWVSEHLDEYPFHTYSPLSPLLRDYVFGRSDDRRVRDPALSFRLGQWLYSVQTIHTKNEANTSTMAWCLEKLRAVKLKNQADEIERHARRFLLPMPEGLSAAMLVQAKDSYEKQREERSRR